MVCFILSAGWRGQNRIPKQSAASLSQKHTQTGPGWDSGSERRPQNAHQTHSGPQNPRQSCGRHVEGEHGGDEEVAGRDIPHQERQRQQCQEETGQCGGSVQHQRDLTSDPR